MYPFPVSGLRSPVSILSRRPFFKISRKGCDGYKERGYVETFSLFSRAFETQLENDT